MVPLPKPGLAARRSRPAGSHRRPAASGTARYLIWAVLVLLALPIGTEEPSAQNAPQPVSRTSRGYTVFVGGAVIGREDVTVESGANGTTISGQGRLSGSSDVVIRRVEVRYGPDWTPSGYELEATVNGSDATLITSFANGTAVTKGVDGTQTIDQTEKVPPRTVVLPNVFFGSFEGLTRRLAATTTEKEFPAFIGAAAQGVVRITGASVEQVQIGTTTINIRRYDAQFSSPRGTVAIQVYTDDTGTLLRVSIPAQRVDVMRDDLAATSARTVLHSNPGDEAVMIPAVGFNLGATLTSPPKKDPAARLPAVVLLAGAASNERDGVVAGVPIVGQLAGALAQNGFVAVRFDKRGHGQSGGRSESATLGDYAEDALAIVRWLSNRRDVDRDRIALVGHNEGAWAALLASTRERRIAGIVSIAAPSVQGSERVLEQQRHVLDRMDLAPSDRVARLELQRRINAAVMTGKGWETIPPDLRKQADTPWFQSVLTFDPARVISGVRQPVLFVHGELDAEVPVSHVERLAQLAQRDSRSRAVAVVTVRGVNHLLTPAVTGDVAEYATLTNRSVSADVTKTIGDWLTKTFEAVR